MDFQVLAWTEPRPELHKRHSDPQHGHRAPADGSGGGFLCSLAAPVPLVLGSERRLAKEGGGWASSRRWTSSPEASRSLGS